jgi:hypothetical protein
MCQLGAPMGAPLGAPLHGASISDHFYIDGSIFKFWCGHKSARLAYWWCHAPWKTYGHSEILVEFRSELYM